MESTTRTIEIMVGNEFLDTDFAELQTKCDPSIGEFIIRAGTRLFLQKEGDSQDQATKAILFAQAEKNRRSEEEYRSRLDRMQVLSQQREEELRKVREEAERHASKENHLLHETNCKQLEEIQKLQKDRDYFFDKGKQEEETKWQKVVELLNDQIVTLKQDVGGRLESVDISMKKVCRDNHQKMILGEFIIEKFLATHFAGHTLENVGNQTATGDFLFGFDAVRMLIEVKNKDRLKPVEDCEKFYRDIDVQVAKGAINCALFVSLHDCSFIGGKRDFYFELRDGVPTIWLGDVLNNQMTIRFAVMTLDYLLKHGIMAKIENEGDKITHLMAAIHGVYTAWNNVRQSTIKMGKSIQDALGENNKNLKELDNIYEHLNGVFMRYPEFGNASMVIATPIGGGDTRDKKKYDDLIHLIAEHKRENPDFPLEAKRILAIEEVCNSPHDYNLSFIQKKRIGTIVRNVMEKIGS